ncbi:hypothetical protein DENSPDRAFT_492841 [Dentipellis sp. KUC8613]|nr:hypothetical protein DENSPDRAFT_492841 [Dentipellis sp. KUC8613]
MSSRSHSNDHTRRGGSEYRPTLPPIRDIFRSELSQPPHPLHASSGPSASSAHRSQQYDDSPHLPLPRGMPQPYDPRPNTPNAPGYPHSLPPFQQSTAPPYPGRLPTPSPTSRRSSIPGGRSFSMSDPHQYSQQPYGTQWTQQAVAPPYAAHGQPMPNVHPAMHPNAYASSSRAGQYPAMSQAAPSMTQGSADRIVYPAGMPERPPSSSAKYECNYCGKGFTRPSSLKIHLHSHTGERPYMCTVEGCGRTFSVQSNMRRHARTHSQSGNQMRGSSSEEGGDEGSEGTPSPRTRASGLVS